MFITIIVAIIALSILVVVHEAGHMIVAKKSGIRVPEFSVGFGPKIFGIKRGGTEYKLSLIPLGGYVKLAGMEPSEIKGEEDEFASKNVWTKLSVIVTGPFFNLLLAFLIISFALLFLGISTLNTTVVDDIGHQKELKHKDKILTIDGKKVSSWDEIIVSIQNKDSAVCEIERNGRSNLLTLYSEDGNFGITPFISSEVGEVARKHPAYKAGIRKGDIITKIDNKEVHSWTEMVNIIQKNANKSLAIEWLRDDSLMNGFVIPKEQQRMVGDSIIKVGIIGISMKLGKKHIGILSFKHGFIQTCEITGLTLAFLGKLISGKVSAKKNLGGPLAVVRVIGESAQWGLESYLNLIAFISIQLFILNLIPFPPLDGGQGLIVLIETIRKKPLSEKGLKLIQNIGFAILILFMAYVTFNDITRMLKK